MEIQIVLPLVILLISACSTTGSITEAQALQRVREKANEMRIPIESRTAIIEQMDSSIRISYPPPEGPRAGSWIFVIDEASGNFSEIIIER